MSKFDDFIKRIYGRSQSVFTCVLGPNESGKTDFNLLQLEKIHDLGIAKHFGSNMKSLEADFEVQFIDDFQTLEQTCRMLNPNPNKHGLKKFFFLGSEIGKWAPRDQAHKSTELIQKLQTVRKYGLSMLTDAIDRVDARVLSPRFFRGEFVKPFKSNKKYAYFFDYTNGRRSEFKKIPKTRIQYDTFETADFFMSPQIEGELRVPLNKEHENVFSYLDNDCSWKKAGIDTQTGKRSMVKVLRFYRAHYFPEIQEKYKDKPHSEVVEST